MDDTNLEKRSIDLLDRSVACDMTLPWQLMIPGRELKELLRFRNSGFNFVALTVADDECWITDTMRYIGSLTSWVSAHDDDLMLVRKVDDIESARRAGKLAVGFHFQGTNPFQGDLGMVQVYYDLGVRHALMAYNRKNLVGDGCHERTDAGLSRFGLKLIEEMNRVGMIIDCTHSGYTTTMEAMDASDAPCIFSHSLSNAVHEHERNIRDDQIKACAAKDGVIGVNGLGIFLGLGEQATTDDLVRHIDHMAQIGGVRCVGIGLDFVYFNDFMLDFYERNKDTHFPKGYPAPPWHYYPPENLPELTEALLRHGYSDDDVRGILGENFLRVANAVWK